MPQMCMFILNYRWDCQAIDEKSEPNRPDQWAFNISLTDMENKCLNDWGREHLRQVSL